MRRVYSQLTINEKINVKSISYNTGKEFGSLPYNYKGTMFNDMILDYVYVWDFATKSPYLKNK